MNVINWILKKNFPPDLNFENIISSIVDYIEKGKWTGNENCSDPQLQFESIVHKLEDLVALMAIKYFDTEQEYSQIDSKIPSEVWIQTDSQQYGRCYTAIPTKNQINLGIKSIVLGFKTSVTVFFHTPEMFQTAKLNTELLQFQDIFVGKIYSLDVKHDIYNMLDNDGEKCSFDHGYRHESSQFIFT